MFRQTTFLIVVAVGVAFPATAQLDDSGAFSPRGALAIAVEQSSAQPTVGWEMGTDRSREPLAVRGEATLAPATQLAGPAASRDVPSAPTVFHDVQIGTGTDIQEQAIDRDAATDHLFVVQRHSTSWEAFISTNSGVSWTSKYSWSDSTPISVDGAAVGGYFYVAYGVDGSSARLRRIDVSDGSIDDAYFYKEVVNVSPKTIEKVVLATNATAYDNRLYYAILCTDGTIYYYLTDTAAGADTFIPNHPSLATTPLNSTDNLSMSWRKGYTSGPYLALSFVDTNDDVWVYRVSASWDAGQKIAQGTAAEETSVSWYRGTIIVAYEDDGFYGSGISYCISYDAGSIWTCGAGSEVAGPGYQDYQPLVDAWSGTGTAIIYQRHYTPAAIDDVRFSERHNYNSGSWTPSLYLNAYGITPAHFGFAFHYLDHGWAIVYIDDSSRGWFVWSQSIAYRGFESGDQFEW